jgi:hypothetical protein
MKVRELIRRLRKLKNQDATVIVANGETYCEWIIASGILETGIKASSANPDIVVPGMNAGVEIM